MIKEATYYPFLVRSFRLVLPLLFLHRFDEDLEFTQRPGAPVVLYLLAVSEVGERWVSEINRRFGIY